MFLIFLLPHVDSKCPKTVGNVIWLWLMQPLYLVEWHLDAQQELHLIALFQISAGHIAPVQIDPRLLSQLSLMNVVAGGL